MNSLQNAIYALKELEEDSSTPKSVRAKLATTINTLNSTEEVSIGVSKALQELESISEDNNVQSDTRIQIFNIVSLLELV
jgi:uncharacterized protein (UPF0147 family)